MGRARSSGWGGVGGQAGLSRWTLPSLEVGRHESYLLGIPILPPSGVSLETGAQGSPGPFWASCTSAQAWLLDVTLGMSQGRSTTGQAQLMEARHQEAQRAHLWPTLYSVVKGRPEIGKDMESTHSGRPHASEQFELISGQMEKVGSV